MPIGTTGLTATPPPPGGGPGVTTQQVRPPTPQATPQVALGGMLENVDGLRRAREALRLATERPESFGFWQGAANALPGVLERTDPEGVAARAAAGRPRQFENPSTQRVSSDRRRVPRLRPFVPTVGDPPNVVQEKLRLFVQEYEAVLRDQYQTFGPSSGYRPQSVVEEALRGAGGASADNDPLGIRRGR